MNGGNHSGERGKQKATTNGKHSSGEDAAQARKFQSRPKGDPKSMEPLYL